MSFRRGGAKKRRDTNEPAIREALHAVGAETWQVSGMGLFDLAVKFRDRYYLMEIKTAKGTLRESQVGKPWPVVRSAAQALTILGLRVQL